MRKIIHIDMDAFYASIEQRDNSALRGKPLAVGSPEGRGVVAAASYEARKFGVYSAMSSKIARQKCPDLIFVPARFPAYKEASNHIRSIFLEYTDMVEPLSLDEAFLDVTQNHKNIELAMTIANEIRARIYQELQLTASAGVSFNKFLAKIASDLRKPNGLSIIHPDHAEKFIEQLAIEKFFGIGKVTAKKMHTLGISTGKDLKNRSLEELIHHFGKQGSVYYANARAIDHRAVNPNRIRKSVGVENTFSEDIHSVTELQTILKSLACELIHRTKKSAFSGRTLTLKARYQNFIQITRSQTTPVGFGEDEDYLFTVAQNLLNAIDLTQAIRLLGLTVSNSDHEDEERNMCFEQLQLPF